MTCRGCNGTIPDGYQHRAYTVEQLVFCNRSCFDRSAERLLKHFLPVMRHIAVNHRSTAADLVRMALRSDKPVPLL